MAEELRRLVVAGLHHDAADGDVAEAAIGLGAQLDGVAVARHHAVGYADVLAEPWRGALQGDAIVVAVGHHAPDDDVVASVQVECVVVVVVAVDHLDVLDVQAVAGQVVLHPSAAVAQCYAAHTHVATADEAQQVGARDALVVPRELGRRHFRGRR